MEIKNILKKFVQICSKELDLQCILQIGSSTYSKNFEDIDLIFFSKAINFSTEEYFKLFSIIKRFKKDYSNISFDMSSPTGDETEYNITIVPVPKLDILYNVDKFFLRFMQKDKERKVLFGKDPLSSMKINFSKRDIIERLSFETNHYVRMGVEKRSVQDFLEFIRYFFKSILRIILVNESVSKKENLILLFKRRYPSIDLPKRSKNILNNSVSKADFRDILKFSESCLNFLTKNN